MHSKLIFAKESTSFISLSTLYFPREIPTETGLASERLSSTKMKISSSSTGRLELPIPNAGWSGQKKPTLVGFSMFNQFLNSIDTIRGDLFYSSQTFNSLTDYRTKDLFYIPCYGAVNNQNYKPILSILSLKSSSLDVLKHSECNISIFFVSKFFCKTHIPSLS